MEDKTFQLLEKMYSEFVSFKEEVNGKFSEVNSKFDEVNGRLRKIELGQEELKDKVSEAFDRGNRYSIRD